MKKTFKEKIQEAEEVLLQHLTEAYANGVDIASHINKNRSLLEFYSGLDGVLLYGRVSHMMICKMHHEDVLHEARKEDIT